MVSVSGLPTSSMVKEAHWDFVPARKCEVVGGAKRKCIIAKD